MITRSDEINKKFLREVQMFHGAGFLKRVPLAGGGKNK